MTLLETLTTLRAREHRILVSGIHLGIIQSILDFDAMLGKSTPSIACIIASNRKSIKFFFGTHEILIPCYSSITAVPEALKKEITLLLNLQSGRRVKDTTIQFFETLPHAIGAHIFAENMPENHALELSQKYGGQCILGPSGVGLLVPGHMKLGAIGGVTPAQIVESALLTPGSVAVIATSGGMIGELIRSTALSGKRVSFASCIGGDRFPVTSYADFFLLAEQDPETKSILYFGELGGEDEYEIVKLIEKKRLTKPVVAYIAGVVDESFPERTQFGHARALARNKEESARAKREALRAVGVTAPDTFEAFLDAIAALPQPTFTDPKVTLSTYERRRPSILSTRKFFDASHEKEIGATDSQFVRSILAVLLPKPPQSDLLVRFTTATFESLIDHGGHVSGAVNTMITARAGKDLVTSLSAGLLTIGPRFGGAVNAAGGAWRDGVRTGIDASTYIETQNKAGKLIPGIGHRKYRLGMPDPRVATLAKFADELEAHPHYDFARSIEAITTTKNGSLILNVDGIISALMLDILKEKEGYSEKELDLLIESELFNAFFVIPRTVGFIGHFLAQKRNDEGLFRLPDDLLFEE